MPRTALIVILLVLSWPNAATAQLADPDELRDVYLEDARERRMRVDFPLHDRLWVAGGRGFGSEPSTEAEAGLSVSLNADFPDEEIWWQLRHEIGRTRYQPQRAANLRFTLLDGDYLRHDTSSAILIPRGADRDIRLPAPFDIAVVWTLGAVSFDLAAPQIAAVDVVDLALLADFIRDEDYRHRLAFGAVGAHATSRRRTGWDHEVVPFSGAMMLYGWEAANGRFATQMKPAVVYGATFSDGVTAWAWSGRGQLEFEWVPLAVNDLPLSLIASGEVDHDFGGATSWSAVVSGRIGVPLGL